MAGAKVAEGSENAPITKSTPTRWQRTASDTYRRMRTKHASNVKTGAQGYQVRAYYPKICEALHAAQMGRCACCGDPLGVDYDLDHAMPLALGGLNVDANMQLLTARCNGRKLAKHPEQYAKERGFCYWPPRDWASVTRARI